MKNASCRNRLHNGRVFRVTVTSAIFLRGNLFAERREQRHEPYQHRANFRQAAFGADFTNENPCVSVTFFHRNQVYDQTFSAISNNRNTETLSRISAFRHKLRRNLFWTKIFGSHVVTSSFETREVPASAMNDFANNAPQHSVGSGGRDELFRFRAGHLARKSSIKS